MKKYKHFLVLAGVILLIFSPILWAGFCVIDDASLISHLKNKTSWGLDALFFRDTTKGLYYRPVTSLTYLWDHFWFHLNPGLMHFENILIHFINACWVFLICQLLLNRKDEESWRWSLMAALIFAGHPLVTEPVNWISGRTDLLAGSFIFAAMYALLRFKRDRHWPWFLVCLLFFLLGCLAKEPSLAFSSAIILVMLSSDSINKDISIKGKLIRNLPRIFIILIACSCILMMFFMFRGLDYSTDQSRIGLTLKYIDNNPFHSLMLIFRGIGYYAKKIIFPWPINFAIMDVDPIYDLLGIPIFIIFLFILLRNRLISSVFISGIMLLSPSLIMVFYQIAWTPFAERYLYLTLGFVVPSVIAFFANANINNKNKRIISYILISIIALFSCSSLYRTYIWQDNYRLISDTIEKSPMAKRVAYVYAGMLVDRGKYAEAIESLTALSKNSSFMFDEKSELGIAKIYKIQGNIQNEFNKYIEILSKTRARSVSAAKLLLKLYSNKKIEVENNNIDIDKIRINTLYKLEKLESKFNSDVILYVLGKIYIFYGDVDKANKYLKKSSQVSFARGQNNQDLFEGLSSIERSISLRK